MDNPKQYIMWKQQRNEEDVDLNAIERDNQFFIVCDKAGCMKKYPVTMMETTGKRKGKRANTFNNAKGVLVRQILLSDA